MGWAHGPRGAEATLGATANPLARRPAQRTTGEGPLAAPIQNKAQSDLQIPNAQGNAIFVVRPF